MKLFNFEIQKCGHINFYVHISPIFSCRVAYMQVVSYIRAVHKVEPLNNEPLGPQLANNNYIYSYYNYFTHDQWLLITMLYSIL